MAKQRIALNNFSSGELNPDLKGRVELPLYYSGAEKIQNFIPLATGGARFKQGTEFISKSARFPHPTDTFYGARLLPFIFNEDQSYQIEMAHSYARILRDKAVVTKAVAVTITDVSNVACHYRVTATDIARVTTGSAHGIRSGERVRLNNVNGITNIDSSAFYTVVSVPSTTTFFIDLVVTGTFSASGSSSITVEVSPVDAGVGPITAFTISTNDVIIELDGHGLKENDFVWIECLNGTSGATVPVYNSLHRVTAISLTGTDTFTIRLQGNGRGSAGAFTFAASANSKVRKMLPYLNFAKTSNLITNWINDVYYLDPTIDASVNVTTDTTPSIQELQHAQAADTMYLSHKEFWPIKIVRASDTDWSWSYFSPTALPWNNTTDSRKSYNDYPGVVGFHDQRLFFAASDNEPMTIWGSVIGAFANFTTGTDPDDAVEFTLALRKIHAIQWLESADKFMLAGTKGGVVRIAGGTLEESIAPNSISTKIVDGKGSGLVQPAIVNKNVFYVNDGLRKVISLLYDINVDGYEPLNANKFSQHLTASGIKALAYQGLDQEILWALRNDGVLIGQVVDAPEKIYAWFITETRTGDIITSISSIPTALGFDQLWMVTERSVDGETEELIEVVSDLAEFPRRVDYYTGDEDDDLEDYRRELYEAQKRSNHLDCMAYFDGTTEGSDASATITPGAATGSNIAFTASASVFVSGDVGRRIWNRTGTGRATIITYTSATVVRCDIDVDFPSTAAIAAGDWYLTTDAVEGLDHLEGEEVQVVADGAIHPDATVTDGSIDLDYQASYVMVGLKYTGIIKTMPIEGGGALGPAQGLNKNIGVAFVRFLNTLGIKIGIDIYNLEKPTFRETGMITDRPPELFSGIKRVNWPENWNREKAVVILQEKPLPCTVQAIYPEVESSD